jgi:hypothetical protein
MPQYNTSRYVLALASLLLMLASGGCGGGSSSGPGSGSGSLNISATPASLDILPNSTSTLTINAAVNNISSTPSVTLGQLPAGLTSATVFPLAVPPSGASITLQASPILAVGSYKLVLKGQAGTASAAISIPVTVENAVSTFSLTEGLSGELGIPIGGSAQKQFGSVSSGQADYDVLLSVSGLPPGATAAINPTTVVPGQQITVTVSASASAPVSQNVTLTLTGTPQAPIAPSSVTFLADVTQSPSSMPNNRTDYLSTEGTPNSAAYDPTHNLIFSSNSSWNRIDVISAATHALIATIDIRDPRGVDITPDNSTLWVSTGSQQMFGINTTTFVATRYLLPGFAPDKTSGLQRWEGLRIFALADGTVLHYLQVQGWGSYLGRWDPSSNALVRLDPPASVGVLARSGDGKWVYSISGDSSGSSFNYSVLGKKFSGIFQSAGYGLGAAVNFDASRIAVCDGSEGDLFDANLAFVASLPACGWGSPPFFEGGTVFSADGRYIYQLALSSIPVIVKIDANTLNIIGVAPAMPMIGVSEELAPPYRIADPFAVDNTGLVLGVQYYGIAFDDSTFTQSFVSSQPGTPTFLQHMAPYVGPLAGGTTSSGFGNTFSLTPGVWYGSNRGSAHVDSGGQLTTTSPPASGPGPVNLKFLFPDGLEVFDPLFFSYGPSIQTAVLAGASPDGNVLGQIAGYGFPTESSGETLSVGGSQSEIGSLGYISSLYGYPFPSNTLTFTVPPGKPGWADIGLTTPTGTSTLAKSLYYAQSVTDYSSPDSFTAVVYDDKRQQLYLSGGDHIDVFSLTLNQFLSPLTLPAQGSVKKFAGLTLTPEGSLLLAADLTDGSLAVVNPDNPASSYAIPIKPAVGASCVLGPLYVAATSDNQAFVSVGSLPAPGCGIGGGGLYLVDLTSRTAVIFNASCAGFYISSSSDGTEIAMGGSQGDNGFGVYNVPAKTCSFSNVLQSNGVAISADANVTTSQWILADTALNIVGRVALPDVYYGPSPSANLQQPRLNDAGSLYYVPFPNFIDIVDVQHGLLRMRFSLGEIISATAVPLALDSGGRHIYLLTDKGLTIIDLGEAPLSIGWVNPNRASTGTQVTVRGSGFNSSTTVTVGNQTATATFIDEDTLTFVVPDIGSGPSNIVLNNSDGTTYKLQNTLTVQ